MTLFMTTVPLIASPIQIQGQPMPEDECAFPNSPISSTADEDSSCKKKSTSNITDVNCIDIPRDGPTICKEAQTPFVPSDAN